jgi:hypothetical protein
MRALSASAEKSAEHNAMGNPEPRTGQHGHHGFRHHRHVNDGLVAGDIAQRLQRVGEAAHQPVKLSVSNRPRVARLAFEKNGGFVPARTFQVPV